MWTDRERLKDMYTEAQKQGFVGDISEPSDCNSDCDHCPALEACELLTEGKDYETFVRNYKELYNVD